MVLCALAAIVVLLRRVKRSDDARLRLFQDIETLTALSAAGEEQAIYWSVESRDEAVTPGLEALIGGAPESGGWFAFITGQLGGEDAAGLEASVSGLRRDGAAFSFAARWPPGKPPCCLFGIGPRLPAVSPGYRLTRTGFIIFWTFCRCLSGYRMVMAGSYMRTTPIAPRWKWVRPRPSIKCLP